MNNDLPLGREVDYPDTYSPDVLVAVSRQRDPTTGGDALPFTGEDIWNAWELTWLNPRGKPQVAAVELRVPATSPNICESKSLKLYLNSFAMSEFPSSQHVQGTIASDLERVVGGVVGVRFLNAGGEGAAIGAWPASCIDDVDIDVNHGEPAELRCEPTETVSEDLYSDLFRSLCPVTAQPDYASVRIHYEGPRIEHASLLRYLLGFRRHQDFHEACVERIFLDLMEHCGCQRLSVNARFLRRGGIDINPWRASYAASVPNGRLWRQ